MIPQISKSPDVNEAKRYVRAITRLIGPGFHPDTDMRDYKSADGSEIVTPPLAAMLNGSLGRARNVLQQASIDICSIALPVQREMLRRAQRARFRQA